MKTIHIVLLTLFAAILASGCVSPLGGPAAGGNGIVIEVFKPDFSEVFSGEPVQLQLKLRNIGSADAEDISAMVMNLEWNKNTKECSESRMLPPDPSRGTEGATKTCIFSYTAPMLSKGISLTYSPTVRVKYRYSTTSVKSLTVLPIADARRLLQQGRTFAAETVSSTSGPIRLDITTKGPIRISGNSVEFPLEVKIQNTGGGTVCRSSCEDSGSNWNTLDVRIDAPGLETTGTCGGEITLFKGQASTITCVLKTGSAEQPVQKQVTATASYGYMIEKPTQIKVTGT